MGDSGIVLKTVNGGVTGLTFFLPIDFGISIFPNPANNILTINLNLFYFEVELYNILGKQMRKIVNQNELDDSSFPDEIYFIKVIVGKNYYSKKFIVKHE